MERTKPKRNVNPWTAFLQPAQALQEDLMIAKLRSRLRLDRYARPVTLPSGYTFPPCLTGPCATHPSLVTAVCRGSLRTRGASINLLEAAARNQISYSENSILEERQGCEVGRSWWPDHTFICVCINFVKRNW
jgi:hypothetical protein